MKTDIAYIYALLDPRDNSIRYIGKTIHPKSRLGGHLRESKSQDHYRARWIRSLSAENLKPIFKILKICPLEEFSIHESFFIKLHKSEILTNSDETGSGNTGRKREIIENAVKKISKKVYQFDLQGNFIQEFKSTRDAARKVNKSHSYISRCCSNEYKHSGGFIYSFHREAYIEPVEKPNAVKRPVVELNADGKVINEWDCLMDCSRSEKLDNGNLSRVCNGKKKWIKGRYFAYK